MKRNKIQVFHHFMLAVTAVMFGMTSSLQLLGVFPSTAINIFLGCSTFLAYRIASHHPYVQIHPFQTGFKNPFPFYQLFLLTLPVLLIIPFLPSFSYVGVILVGIVTCSYFLKWGKAGKLRSGLRSVPLLKNILLAGAWSVTTVWFPCHALGYTEGTLYLFFARFIFILAICFGVDLRDMMVDKKHNLITLPVLFGYKKIQWLCIILLMVFNAFILLKPTSVEIPFRSGLQECLLVFSSICTAVSILMLKKDSSHNSFTILLDGNMFLQSLLLLLFR